MMGVSTIACKSRRCGLAGRGLDTIVETGCDQVILQRALVLQVLLDLPRFTL